MLQSSFSNHLRKLFFLSVVIHNFLLASRFLSQSTYFPITLLHQYHKYTPCVERATRLALITLTCSPTQERLWLQSVWSISSSLARISHDLVRSWLQWSNCSFQTSALEELWSEGLKDRPIRFLSAFSQPCFLTRPRATPWACMEPSPRRSMRDLSPVKIATSFFNV